MKLSRQQLKMLLINSTEIDTVNQLLTKYGVVYTVTEDNHQKFINHLNKRLNEYN